jgi:YD repeat-containing protein
MSLSHRPSARSRSRSAVAPRRLFRKLFTLGVCALLVWQSPAQAIQSGADSAAAGLNAGPVRSRPLPPLADLPNPADLLAEGRNLLRPVPTPPPLKPSTLCGYKDWACKKEKEEKEKREKEQKVGQVAAPGGADVRGEVAAASEQTAAGWFKRLGRKVSDALFGQPSRSLFNLTPRGHSFAAAEATRAARAPASLPASAAKTAAAVTALPPPSFDSLLEARLDAHNRTGGAGEDLFSGNYHRSVPLVSLPGRAGLDLEITLHYNSLVWTRYSNSIAFDADYYATLTPGFRLGFPEIEYHVPGGVEIYLALLPSGRRVELRAVAADEFEATDGSYLYLKRNPGAQTMTLYATDGTQFIYTLPPNSPSYRCTQVKDANGNYLSVTYTTLGSVPNHLVAISTVTDTLGRVINFNYDANFHLLSLTQAWGGATRTWAQFDYANLTLNHNFGSLAVSGPASGTQIPVITRVITADGARHVFVYNSWGQAEDFWLYGEADNQRAALDYVLPGAAQALSDCPRPFQRNDYIALWAGAGGTGWVSNYIALDPNETYGQVTTPDGVTHKELFGTSGATRGLMTGAETWHGGQKKKWTTLTWASDDATRPLRPRVTQALVSDDADGNGTPERQRRTTTEYTTLLATNVKLPAQVREYDADTTTLLRRTQTTYVEDANYTSRRLLGLPSTQSLYNGGGALMAQTGYVYDTAAELQATPTAASRHDAANYGTGFLYRGNLTKVRRYNVPTTPDDGIADFSYTETTTGYHTTGSVAFTKDALNHQTTISYADSFAGGVAPNPQTYAYPTSVTDPDGHASTAKYNYYFGAVTESTDPKGARVERQYDARDRLERVTNAVNGAYTRYVYDLGHNWVQAWATVNSLSEEAADLSLLDGAGRERMRVKDHPGSAGGLSAMYRVYDQAGRVVEWSNPTEVCGWCPQGWITYGDDQTAGYRYSTQAYDWQSRPTVTTNQDATTRQVQYDGCGCAGSSIVTAIDEVGRRQKMHYDVLGRAFKAEVLKQNAQNPNQWDTYSATVTTYNVRDQATVVKTYQGDPAGDGGCPTSTCQQTEMVYDGYGRAQRRYLPVYQDAGINPPYSTNSAARFMGWQYYSDDTLSVVTDPRNASATYSYNNRDLPTQITYSAPAGITPAPPVTFGYDQAGNRTSMTDGLGAVTYQYDTLSRLQSEARTFTGLSGAYTLSYQYNLAGQVTQMSYASARAWGNFSTSYARDKAGRLTAVSGTQFAGETSFASGLQYRAWGALKAMTFGQGGTVTANFNARLQLQEYKTVAPPLSTGTPTLTWGQYQYYADGRVKYAEDKLNADFDRAYTYDFAARLKEATSGPEARDVLNGTQSGQTTGPYRHAYGWDAWGNQTAQTGRFWTQPEEITSTWSSGRRTIWGYDAAGHVTSTGDNSYEFNAAGRNHRATSPALGGGMNISQQWHDGNGQVVKRDPNTGGVEYYVRSSALGGAVIVELDGQQGDRKNAFVYAGESRLATLGATLDGNYQSITWETQDPLTGKAISGYKYTNAGGTYFHKWTKSEPDPTGIHVGESDPFITPTPSDADVPTLVGGGGQWNPLNPKFNLDGTDLPLESALRVLQFGVAYVDPNTTDLMAAHRAGVRGHWEEETTSREVQNPDWYPGAVGQDGVPLSQTMMTVYGVDRWVFDGFGSLRGGQGDRPVPKPAPTPFVKQTDLSLEFVISQGDLNILDNCTIVKTIKAESGTNKHGNKCLNNPNCTRNPNEGPLPSGEYFINVKEIYEPGVLKRYSMNFRTGDWGSFLVPIHPRPSTDTIGNDGKPRRGFYLHSGKWEGSAGCIDIRGGWADQIGGSQFSSKVFYFLQTLRSDKDGVVSLRVRP